MSAALFAGMVFLPLVVIGAVASWRARSLLASGPYRARRYFAHALVVGLLVPAALLLWNTMDLVLRYAPDRCGSGWLGASEAACTLFFYVASRTLAAVMFLLGPVAVLCLTVSFGVFWTVKARGVNR